MHCSRGPVRSPNHRNKSLECRQLSAIGSMPTARWQLALALLTLTQSLTCLIPPLGVQKVLSQQIMCFELA